MIHDETTAGHMLEMFAPPDEFVQFTRALVEADVLTTGDRGDFGDFIYFLEKPWKYAAEFYAWDKAGRPMDASAAGWEAWCEAVER